MSKIVAFLIIMLIALTLGGLGSGIYVAMIRNRSDEEKEKNPVNIAPVVSLIMVISLLLGLVVFGIYYLATMPPEKVCPPAPECKKCAECVLSEDDFRRLKQAENDIAAFQEKANYVPSVRVEESCRGGEVGVEGGGCANWRFKSPPQPSQVPYITPPKVHPPLREVLAPVRREVAPKKLQFASPPLRK